MSLRKLIDIVKEASGYIAKDSKEAKDPRFSNGMTQDVKPGEINRQASKFGNEYPPPVINSKAAKNSTPNKLMNLGLTEATLLEKGMDPKELRKHEGTYLLALIGKIKSKEPLELTPSAANKYKTKSVTPKAGEHKRLANIFFPDGDYTQATIKNGQMQEIDPKGLKLFKLRTVEGPEVLLSDVQKTADIKGKNVDFNIGDIGEFALGIAITTKFINKGQLITLDDFYSVAQTLGATASKGGSAIESYGTFKIAWGKLGKTDSIHVKTVIPGRSANYMNDVLSGKTVIDPKVEATISSAINYANQSQKISVGVDYIRSNPESNKVEVLVDGVSNAKGTKADLILTIDKKRMNLISAKVGKSQLGQATGHDFNKQVEFFKTVFDVDISKYAKRWGKTHQEHFELLKDIWTKIITPPVVSRLKGNNTVNEFMIIKRLAGGLIRYANSSDSDAIDIVKLISTPGSPGYKLLRVDQRLFEAMKHINLEVRPGAAGITIYGSVDGTQKKILLANFRSYWSPAGNTVRTVVEGGPLLDILSEVVDDAEEKKDTTKKSEPRVKRAIKSAPVTTSVGRKKRK